MQLRPEQTDLIERTRVAMRRHRRVLVQAPTGFGKSVVLCEMVAAAAKRCPPVWIATHRKELLDQLSRLLWSADVAHSWVLGTRSSNRLAAVQLGSIISYWNRRGKLRRPGMVVVDEAHHCTSPTYRRLLAHVGDAWIIGLTATPARLDGEPLGDIFDGLVLGPTTAELIKLGRLSPYRLIGATPPQGKSGMKRRAGDFTRASQETWLADKKILGDGPGHYTRHIYPGTSLVFCPTRRVAKLLRDRYQAASISCEYVGGDTPAKDRAARVAALQNGTLKVLTSVDLFSEGLDCPGLSAVQLMRPTESLALYLQQVGRALRVEEGKTQAIIVDHVKNVWRHGLPDAERTWELGIAKVKRRTPGDRAMRLAHCRECFAIFRPGPRWCPTCGKPVVVVEPVKEDRSAQLTELQEAQKIQRGKLQREVQQARTLDDLVAIARARGYKRGWAAHRWAARQGRRPDARVRQLELSLWRKQA